MVETRGQAPLARNAELRAPVESYYARYAKHDLKGLPGMMDDDIHIYFPIDEKPKVGKAQIRDTWGLSFGKIIPDIRPEVSETEEALGKSLHIVFRSAHQGVSDHADI